MVSDPPVNKPFDSASAEILDAQYEVTQILEMNSITQHFAHSKQRNH